MVSASSMVPLFERVVREPVWRIQIQKQRQIQNRSQLLPGSVKPNRPLQRQKLRAGETPALPNATANAGTAQSTPLGKENESVMITRFGDAGDDLWRRGGSMRRGARVVTAAVAVTTVVVAVAAAGQAVEVRRVTFRAVISLFGVSEVEVWPDGKWIAYSVETPDME